MRCIMDHLLLPLNFDQFRYIFEQPFFVRSVSEMPSNVAYIGSSLFWNEIIVYMHAKLAPLNGKKEMPLHTLTLKVITGSWVVIWVCACLPPSFESVYSPHTHTNLCISILPSGLSFAPPSLSNVLPGLRLLCQHQSLASPRPIVCDWENERAKKCSLVA